MPHPHVIDAIAKYNNNKDFSGIKDILIPVQSANQNRWLSPRPLTELLETVILNKNKELFTHMIQFCKDNNKWHDVNKGIGLEFLTVAIKVFDPAAGYEYIDLCLAQGDDMLLAEYPILSLLRRVDQEELLNHIIGYLKNKNRWNPTVALILLAHCVDAYLAEDDQLMEFVEFPAIGELLKREHGVNVHNTFKLSSVPTNLLSLAMSVANTYLLVYFVKELLNYSPNLSLPTEDCGTLLIALMNEQYVHDPNTLKTMKLLLNANLSRQLSSQPAFDINAKNHERKTAFEMMIEKEIPEDINDLETKIKRNITQAIELFVLYGASIPAVVQSKPGLKALISETQDKKNSAGVYNTSSSTTNPNTGRYNDEITGEKRSDIDNNNNNNNNNEHNIVSAVAKRVKK